MQYRQGDVFLVRINELPSDAKSVEPEEGRIILARGEVTGHHHSLKANVGQLTEREGVRYLRMDLDGLLEHPEHTHILVPKGTYQVIVQREYHPEAIRNVQD